MINEDIYSKLTSSAKDALTEVGDEFVESLLEKAYVIALERGTPKTEISLRDILEARRPIGLFTTKVKREYKRDKRIMILYIGFMTYSVGGLAIFLIQNKRVSIFKDVGILITVVGLLGSLLTQFYSLLILRRERRFKAYYNNLSDFEIVKEWQIIEELSGRLMSNQEQDDPNAKSVGSLIRFLSHKVARNEDEFLKIRELLRLRNKIVHEQYRATEAERLEYLEFAEELIERLENAKEEQVPEKKLRVISASYGTEQNSFDATRELNQLINNNRLEFILNNEIVGDPQPGSPKVMTITYEVNGDRQTRIYNEGAKVVISG